MHSLALLFNTGILFDCQTFQQPQAAQDLWAKLSCWAR